MSMLSPQNEKSAKGKKTGPGNAQAAKLNGKAGKTSSAFVKQKTNMGSRRGS